MKLSTVSISLIFFWYPQCFLAQDYAQTLHNTMWADFLYYNKQHVYAQDWYQNIIKDCTLPYPLRSYSLLLFDMKKFASILQYKNQLQAYFKHDIEIQKAIAFSLVHEKKNQEAITLLIELSEKFPHSYDVVIPTAQILVQQGNLLKAKLLLEKVMSSRIHKNATPLCMVLLAQIYLKENNIDAAYAMLAQCTKYQPSYAPAWLILGALEESKNNIPAALNAYRNFSIYSPIHNSQLEQRIQMLSEQQNNIYHSHISKQYTQNILKLLSQQQYATALVSIKQGLSENNNDVSLRALYIHTLVATESYAAALVIIAQYIKENPNDYRWWATLHLLSLHPKIALLAYDTLKNTRLQYLSVIWGYLYEADYTLRIKDYVHAHDLYTQALCITQNEAVQAELYFMQALCGYELHNYTLVTYAITHGLQCRCVHAPLYNLAAYYYAHIGNYEKAIALVSQCCTLEPHNEHYQDTAAFIAYKQNRITDVTPIYLSLHTAHPTDATIALHAAQAVSKQRNTLASRKLLAHAENHAYSKYEKRRIHAYLHAGIL